MPGQMITTALRWVVIALFTIMVASQIAIFVRGLYADAAAEIGALVPITAQP